MMGDDGVMRSRAVPVAPEELEERLAKAERFERGESKLANDDTSNGVRPLQRLRPRRQPRVN